MLHLMGVLAWLRRHWISILGGIFLIPPILRGLRFALDIGGYIDFFVAHMTEPGWLGVIIALLTGPPPWIIWPSIVFGFGLIYLGRRRSVVGATAARQITSDANLVFECHLAELPAKVPPEGHIATLPLFYSPDSGVLRPISLSTIHGQPGSNFVWFSDLKFPQVYRAR